MEIFCYQCSEQIGYTVPFSDHRGTYALCYECLRQLLEEGLVHERPHPEPTQFDHARK